MSFPISIVIPTWNGLHLLRENLPSIQVAAEEYEQKTGNKTEIIVVDDGSEDATCSSIASEFSEVRLISREDNGGFAVACNTGFENCRFPLVSLFNNDVWISRDYLIYQALHFQDSQVFAVTPKVYEWEQPIFASGGRFARFRKGFWSVYFNYDVNLPKGVRWISERRLLSIYAIGGFATYSKAKLDALGGFNELLSPFHWEDIDLSYRGWKRGWEVHYEPRSIARHRTSATIKTHFKKRLVEEVSIRNRLLFHWINVHSPNFLIRHLLMLTALLLTRILVLDISFYRAYFRALKRLPQALKLRRTEGTHSRRTDTEISRLLTDFFDSAPIEIYYNRQDVIRKHPEFKETET